MQTPGLRRTGAAGWAKRRGLLGPFCGANEAAGAAASKNEMVPLTLKQITKHNCYYTDRCNESGQESRGIFAAGSTEAPDFFSRTADGAPLRAIEARVCSPCAPSPPACAPRSLAGWQAAKTAWAELHQPRRTARTSSADRGRQWRATGSSQPRDGAHSAGVGRSPRHGGARQLPSQDSLRLNCRSRF